MVSADQNWLKTLDSLPISPFLSKASWDALVQYLQSGSMSQRGYRLVEFFKALDWLPMDEIEPNPLKQFSHQDLHQIQQDIESYFRAKQSKRQAEKEKRETYRLRVFAYFREQISAQDKHLLESLRDYELERIGQDVNWRHYFWFTSFKQIDAFNQQTPFQRQGTILQFKQDVEQHYKNAQRLREGSYANYYWGDSFESDGETFDEWANRQTGYKHKNNGTPPHQSAHAIKQAYQTLQLSPGASIQEVRQQFRRLVLTHHPDMPDGNSEKMKAILAAYDVVKQVSASQVSSS